MKAYLLIFQPMDTPYKIIGAYKTMKEAAEKRTAIIAHPDFDSYRYDWCDYPIEEINIED